MPRGTAHLDTGELDRYRTRLKRKAGKTDEEAAKVSLKAMLVIEKSARDIARSGIIFSSRSTGHLARNLKAVEKRTFLGSRGAVLTSHVVYAAIQNFGGETRPGTRIPATHYAFKAYLRKKELVNRLLGKVFQPMKELT